MAVWTAVYPDPVVLTAPRRIHGICGLARGTSLRLSLVWAAAAARPDRDGWSYLTARGRVQNDQREYQGPLSRYCDPMQRSRVQLGARLGSFCCADGDAVHPGMGDEMTASEFIPVVAQTMP